MPPKKVKSKQTLRKKPSEKCHFNNRGYCKSKECELKHSDDLCEDEECTEDKCEKRHPYECKFGTRCKFKKKDECMYLHDTHASGDLKIEAFKKQFNDKVGKLEISFLKIQSDLEESNSLIEVLMKKNDSLEKQLEESHSKNLLDELKDKDAQMNGQKIKLGELEEKKKK